MTPKTDEQTRKAEKEIKESYDKIPYANYTFSQTHIAHLAAIGLIHGMNPPSVENCRVLELGCGRGGNIIPMAANFPESEFVGIDLSSKHIEDAQQFLNGVDLSNIKVENTSILDVDETFGKFDYIITHGVFSWVPPAVRQKILQISKDLLTPNGISYISYNTYPGWHIREKFRRMMSYHVRDIEDPYEKITKGIELIKDLAEVHSNEDAKRMLTSMEDLSSASSYFIHEFFERFNQPFYFHEFVELIDSYDLQYLSDAEITRSELDTNLGAYLSQRLGHKNPERIKLEQHIDFLRERCFRQSLICRKEVNLSEEPLPESTEKLYVTTFLKPANRKMDLSSIEPETFQDDNNNEYVVQEGFLKGALLALNESYPGYLAFSDIVTLAYQKLESHNCQIFLTPKEIKKDSEELQKMLVLLQSVGLVNFRSSPPQFCLEITNQPRILPIAKEQARIGESVTNALHDRKTIEDEFTRQLICLLDGKKTYEQVAQKLEKMIYDGDFKMFENGSPSEDPHIIFKNVRDQLDKSLQKLAYNLLLIS